ncbi:hypothetical protein ACJ73_01151 [Blastomyces percursus]|uniref:Uncharacterized protein n=1 Tax=Blastomyces percursus TaxID=1658174 RepID=A0A1J9RIL7_9EURO|nr:hypothetical protein ACJ73_01151 [Blastomyces percursus]
MDLCDTIAALNEEMENRPHYYDEDPFNAEPLPVNNEPEQLNPGEVIFSTPPPHVVYDTIEEGIKAINDFAGSHGYAVVKRGITRGGRHHDGPIIRVYLTNTWPPRYNTPLFVTLHTKISPYAIKLVADIRDQFLPVGGPNTSPIPGVCTGKTTTTLGVPCIHVIRDFIAQGTPLECTQFHSQCHLAPISLNPIDPRLLLLNPLIIRTRGRPAGATNRISTAELSTRRDPSGFEYVDGPARGRGRGRGRGQAQARGNSGNQEAAEVDTESVAIVPPVAPEVVPEVVELNLVETR